MAPADLTWFAMESRNNLMVISGIVTFKEIMPLARFQQVVVDRLINHHPRFKQTIQRTGRWLRPLCWTESDNFDIAYHIKEQYLEETHPFEANRLASYGKEAGLHPHVEEQPPQSLKQRVSELISTPLDRDYPLWQFDLIHVNQSYTALILRIHHSIADGISLIRVLLSITGETAHASLEEKTQISSAIEQSRLRRSLFNRLKSWPKRLSDATKKPGQTLHKIAWRTGRGFIFASAVCRLLTMRKDPTTPFKGELNLSKTAVWADNIPLAEIKAIATEANCKINDVLMSTMAGALRHYLTKTETFRNQHIRDFRAVVPFNLRPLSHTNEIKLGNDFGLIFLTLPILTQDPIQRLNQIKARMDRLKRSPDALLAHQVMGLLGIIPRAIGDKFINLMGRKSTIVATNVPGPNERLFWAGGEIDKLNFWVPQSGKLGIGFSILSYAGSISIGVIVDAGLVDDPELILDGFKRELDLLRNHFQVGCEKYRHPNPLQAI